MHISVPTVNVYETSFVRFIRTVPTLAKLDVWGFELS